ncbi:uncharacterized [Tachysurus ichikawai]
MLRMLPNAEKEHRQPKPSPSSPALLQAGSLYSDLNLMSLKGTGCHHSTEQFYRTGNLHWSTNLAVEEWAQQAWIIIKFLFFGDKQAIL